MCSRQIPDRRRLERFVWHHGRAGVAADVLDNHRCKDGTTATRQGRPSRNGGGAGYLRAGALIPVRLLCRPVAVVLGLPIRAWLTVAEYGFIAVDRIASAGAERPAAGDSSAEAACARKTAVRREDLADVIQLSRDRGRRRSHDR
jgi:hypothetical protein